MKPLNQELKDIRTEKGVTLEEIYRETKIRVPFLEKIEEGDFSVVPEPFMRAFLREYAEAVGIDPERVIAKYEGKEVAIRDEKGAKIEKGTPGVTNSPIPPAKIVPEKQRSSPEGKKPSPAVPAEEPLPEPQAAAIKIISDEPSITCTPETASPDRARGLPDDEEEKSPRALLFGVFAVVIILATLAILYLNGIISF